MNEESLDEDPRSTVELVGESRIAAWQMLYCGGSQAVVDALKDIRRQLGIKLNVEKFDW